MTHLEIDPNPVLRKYPENSFVLHIRLYEHNSGAYELLTICGDKESIERRIDFLRKLASYEVSKADFNKFKKEISWPCYSGEWRGVVSELEECYVYYYTNDSKYKVKIDGEYYYFLTDES